MLYDIMLLVLLLTEKIDTVDLYISHIVYITTYVKLSHTIYSLWQFCLKGSREKGQENFRDEGRYFPEF